MTLKEFQNIYRQLLQISKEVSAATTLKMLQDRIANNVHLNSFLEQIKQWDSKPLPTGKSAQTDIFYAGQELLKLMNSSQIQNLHHHFDCLLVPFERSLQNKTTDEQIFVTTQDKKQLRKTFPLRLILENLRSEFNVGSIFRTAECFGVEHIALCGYTPLPNKTDMNTKKAVAHSMQTLDVAMKEAQKLNFRIIGLETVPQGKSLHQIELPEKTCFVFGNERHGLMPETLQFCDDVVRIPMFGNKNSLNVGMAVSLSIYEYLRSRDHL
ncbi:MAG: TrmH family RNA methyltransferase [Pseudobdellovibrionaceae bacterium]